MNQRLRFVLSALLISFFGLLLLRGTEARAAWTFSDPGFFTETVTTLPAFTPVGLTWAPDGRMFIWTKNGIVRIYKNGALLPTPFIDISHKVNIVNDRGMLGLALDPNYAANGYVYLLYVYEGGGNPNSTARKVSLLTRVTSDPNNRDVALAGSEVTLIGSTAQIPCPDPTPTLNCIPADDDSHLIGTLRFAADGKLFFSSGDAASYNFADPLALRSQDLNSYAGKILRVNPDGSAPSDNPFYDGTNSVRSRVWAYGIRNTYRFSLHPLTGVPFGGEVGWVTWEEVNKLERGKNFGWPCYEGAGAQPQYQANFTLCQNLPANQVTPPLYTYFHDAAGGSSAIGGAFYQGSQYPAPYVLNYFWADYSARWVRRMVFDASGNLQNVLPFASNIGTDLGGLVSLELGPDGYLYYVEITTGIIGRIRHTSGGGANQAPVAAAAANPASGYAPLNVVFSSAGSFDPEGFALSYLWNFGDGTTSTQANPAHTYTGSGVNTYNVTLTVTDNLGLTAAAQTAVTVGSTTPTVTINAPANGAQITPGDTINFSGSATDAEDGSLPATALHWTILIHHNTHAHVMSELDGAGGSIVIENHDPSGNYSYEFILTATDSSGLSASKSVILPLLNPLGGPVAALGLNESSGATAADASGNGHTGTLANSPVWVAGQYGGAVSFDGVDDAVALANPATLNFGSSDFTIMAWIKRQQLGGGQRHIFSKCDSANWASGCKELYFNANDNLSFGSYASGDTFAATIADNNWHHIAVTFIDSSNTLQIYVDGSLRTTVTKPLEADGASHVVTIGNMHGSNTFSGTIDEVRVYARALTAGEILSDMSTPIVFVPDTSAPVLSNGQPTGTLAAGTTQTTLGVTTNENATCRYSSTAGVSYSSMTSTFATTGTTTHATTISGLVNAQSYTYYVRCQDGTGNASASDFVISFAVADTTVSEPPVVNMTAPANGVIVSGAITVSADATDNVGVAGVQFLLDGNNLGAEDTVAPYSVTWDTTTAANGSHNLTARARDGAGNQTTATPVTVTVSNAAPTGLVAALALNEGAGSSAADSAGGGHTGTLVNGPAWVSGQFGAGLQFDGSDDALSIANPATFNFGTHDFTMMAWVKRNQLGGGQRHIISKCDSANWASGCKELYFTPSNVLSFGSYSTGDTLSLPIADTNWHHIAVTFVDSSNTLQIYVDGVLRTTATKSLEADGANHVVAVGNLHGSNTFSGTIDEVRIYDRALSATEVATEMNTPIGPIQDVTAPSLSNGQPTGTLAAGTTQATLTVTSNESATCRYSTTAGVSYSAMTNTFATTGGTNHSSPITGLSNGQSYTYYVRCQDAASNANTADFTISFAVAAADVVAPVLSNGQPSGTLAAGTTQTTLGVTTNENATCRYGTTPGVAYASMANSFATTGGTGHTQLIAGLVNGQSYTYYLRCQDAAGNANGSDFVVGFSVAAGDAIAPSVSVTAPSNGATVSGSISVSADAADNVGVAGVQFLLDGAALGAEDTSAPYSITWNTTTAANGAHTISARARDAAGNQTTAANVSVTVSNTAPTGLVAAYGMNEGSGGSIADSSGAGHTGTLVNGPLWGAGQYGTGIIFDGVNDSISVANPATFNFGTADFTMMAWVKRSQLGGGQRHIISKCAASSWVSGCKEFYFLPDNRLTFGSHATGDAISIAIADANWHHVAVTFTDSTNTLRIYVDGVLQTTATKALEADGANHVVAIGNMHGNNTFSGTIDEVRIYNRALSAAEIATARTTPITP